MKELSLEQNRVLSLRKEKDVFKEKSDEELLKTINQIIS
jgi:hypothetical protein